MANNDENLADSWAWFVVPLVLVIALPRLIRVWFPDISFGVLLLIIIPIVVLARLALIASQRRKTSNKTGEDV